VGVNEVTFEQFDTSDLAEWLARTNAEYLNERMAAGDTLDEATADADGSMQRTFPGGLATPGQLAGRVLGDGQRIGELWVGQFGGDPQRWWVWDVRIDEAFRGQGLGRRTMLLAEDLARANGAVTIGLNVFAHNGVARRLYASLAYNETSVQMRKELIVASDEETGPSPADSYASWQSETAQNDPGWGRG
jgi:ribosomal protein S18 acetylase RimI-like enzyme